MITIETDFQIAGLTLETDASTALYRQLFDCLRQAILDGRLRPGQRLPPTRILANELGVSRNTVLLAFDYLFAEGYLLGKSGSGTFVTDNLPEKLLRAQRPALKKARSQRVPRSLSKRGQLIAKTSVSVVSIPEAIEPFQTGLPAINEFPFALWTRLLNRQWRTLPESAFGYGDAAGYGPLREALAVYLRTSRAARCDADHIIIVNGSQQALDLCARVLLDAGESCWFEEPGYRGARGALLAAGLKLTPVPVDNEGLNVPAGQALDPNARLAYVTPSHQYPLGVTMSLTRRLQLLEWANRAGAWILEDDYDSEYRYAGPPLSSLQGLDRQNRVIYIGTFSKVMIPALRLGYMVVPPDLMQAFVMAKSQCDRHSPIVEQAALAQFISEGHFSRHIRRMRSLYKKRQDALIEAARRQLQGLLQLHPSEAGLHLAGWLPNSINDHFVSERLGLAGVVAPAISKYYLKASRRKGLVLGYAAFNEKQITEAVTRLADVLKEIKSS